MADLEASVDSVAQENGFSGAVRVDRLGEVVLAVAYGFADRARSIPNEVDTRFAIASGTKALTALAVVSLIEEGVLQLSTTARSLLGDDLPVVGDGVTVEHLLAHRSGIGDYADEEAGGEITDHVLPVPVHELDRPEAYLAVLGGHPSKFPPGERFSYCNSGFALLAVVAERASGSSFSDVVRTRVCEPAGMTSTAFLRSDELPGDAALGYLPITGVSRTNVFHLPVVGTGDGGIYSTIGDVHRLWESFFGGQIVPPPWVDAMVEPRSESPSNSMRYGLGFWLEPMGRGVMLEGYDAGVSFRSCHYPDTAITWTVVSNTSDGAWPIARCVAAQMVE